MVVFGQSSCNRANWLSSGRVVVVRQSEYICARWLYSGKRGINQARWLYSDKNSCIWEKVVVFVQKWLYSGKVVVIGKKLLLFGQKGC